MGRAPCCDKVGLKKGPWTPEEDQVLINFIQLHGHSNWRALPKQAGLLRCGKSCRLRWINYLRPDIKRGNFSREEEETIIQLHEMMGNRWSAIAARLPGRTDNEIKNVWHTHLKKRLKQYQQPKKSQLKNARKNRDVVNNDNVSTTSSSSTTTTDSNNNVTTSPQESYTNTSEDFSSSNTEVSSIELPNNDNNNNNIYNNAQSVDNSMEQQMINMDYFSIIDETFWESSQFDDTTNYDHLMNSNVIMEENNQTYNYGEINNNGGPANYGDDNLEFWLDVFVQAGGAPELPDF